MDATAENYAERILSVLSDISNELGYIGGQLRQANEAGQEHSTCGEDDFTPGKLVPVFDGWEDSEDAPGVEWLEPSAWTCQGTEGNEHLPFQPIITDHCPVAGCGRLRDAF